MLRGLTGTPMRRIDLREELVGRRRARAVDVGELDDEIVDVACYRRCAVGMPVRPVVMSSRNFCMSQARSGSAPRTGRNAGRRPRP